MKKVFLTTAVVGFIALGFTSCKKDYTCECTTSIPGQNPFSASVTIENSTKDDAKTACEAGNSTYVSCSIN